MKEKDVCKVKQSSGTENETNRNTQTLLSMANLATIYSDLGNLKEAEELELQVLDMRKKLLGAEHPDTLLSMGNLARTYSD